MAGDDAQERGLARAVAAEQPGDRHRLDVEGDVVQGGLVAIAAAQPYHPDCWRHNVAIPSRISATSSSALIPSRLASATSGST
jgi:hypothetical protein